MENQNSNPVPLPWEAGRNKNLFDLSQQMATLVDQAKRQNFQLDTNDAIDNFRGRDDFYKLARNFYVIKYGLQPPAYVQWMEGENDIALSAHWRAEQQKKKPKG
jgi:hypothetical protein